MYANVRNPLFVKSNLLMKIMFHKTYVCTQVNTSTFPLSGVVLLSTILNTITMMIPTYHIHYVTKLSIQHYQ